MAFGVLLMRAATNALDASLPLSVQHGLWWLGLVCVGYGFGGRWPQSVTRLAWMVAGVMLLGAIPRMVALDDGLRFLPDEAIFLNGIVSLEAVNGRARLIYPVSDYLVASWLVTLWQGAAVSIFGHTTMAARLISALVGTLWIAGVALLARELALLHSSKRADLIGLAAAVLMAGFAAQVHYSRLALYNIIDPLFGMVALGFLARAWRLNQASAYVWAGVALGAAQYFYEGGRLTWLPLVIGWTLIQRRLRAGVILTAITTMVIGTPAWFGVLAVLGSPTPRLDTVGELSTQGATLSERLGDVLALIVWHGDPPYSLYYGASLIGIVLLPCFVVGLGRTLFRWRTPAGSLLLLWLAGVIGAAVVFEINTSARFVGVLPALLLICGVGLLGLIRWPRVLWAALIILSLGQVWLYFGVTLPQMHVTRYATLASRATYDEYDAVIRAAATDSRYVFFIANSHPMAGIPGALERLADYYLPARTVQVLTPDFVDSLATLPADTPITLLVYPPDSAALVTLGGFLSLPPPRGSDDVPADAAMLLYDGAMRSSGE